MCIHFLLFWLRDWLQTSLPMILPGGHHKVPCQVYYPKPSTMGPPSCFNIYIWTYLDMTSIGNILTTSRCCKYCNGMQWPTFHHQLLACFAKLQTLSTFVNCWLAWYFGKPNLWPLNVLSDGNKLTVNPFKSEKNPIPWFDTVIRCVAVISVMQVQSSSDSATRSTGESAAKPQVHLSLGPVPKQLPLCPRYNQRHHQKITTIRTNSKDLWRISVFFMYFMCTSKISCYSRLHPCHQFWFFRMDLTDPTIPTHHPTLTASVFF